MALQITDATYDEMVAHINTTIHPLSIFTLLDSP